VGERYIQLWAPDDPNFITVEVGNALSPKLEVGERRSLASHYTLTTRNSSSSRSIVLIARFYTAEWVTLT